MYRCGLIVRRTTPESRTCWAVFQPLEGAVLTFENYFLTEQVDFWQLGGTLFKTLAWTFESRIFRFESNTSETKERDDEYEHALPCVSSRQLENSRGVKSNQPD